MRILLSAYACEPGKGSEPGVGWNWCLTLAEMGHEVCVITRANNKDNIESMLKTMPPLPNLTFTYYDLPAWASWWKRGSKTGLVNVYYALWQWGAYQKVKKVCQENSFDVVHHITFGVFRQPSFMGRLGVPFIFGPVGGGERAPFRLRKNYSLQAHLQDFFRDMANFIARFDPLLNEMFDRATLIYVKTPMTAAAIPIRYHSKTRQLIEIGIKAHPDRQLEPDMPAQFSSARPLRLLYVGHFFSLKGIQLALPALAQLLKGCPHVRLTMVGKGGEEARWKQLSLRLGVAEHIEWVHWVSQSELYEIYRVHDVLLFPSLHDSSGNVLLESMSFGLPVVCFDLGGPAVIVNNACGRVVETAGCDADQAVEKLYAALREIYDMGASDRMALCQGALSRSLHFSWESAVSRVYEQDIVDLLGGAP